MHKASPSYERPWAPGFSWEGCDQDCHRHTHHQGHLSGKSRMPLYLVVWTLHPFDNCLINTCWLPSRLWAPGPCPPLQMLCQPTKGNSLPLRSSIHLMAWQGTEGMWSQVQHGGLKRQQKSLKVITSFFPKIIVTKMTDECLLPHPRF